MAVKKLKERLSKKQQELNHLEAKQKQVKADIVTLEKEIQRELFVDLQKQLKTTNLEEIADFIQGVHPLDQPKDDSDDQEGQPHEY